MSENTNCVQVALGKSPGQGAYLGKKMIKRVIETNQGKLKAEIENEKQRKLTLQSQIDALNEKINAAKKSDVRREQTKIQRLEKQVEDAKDLLASKIRELELHKTAEKQTQIQRSPLTKSVELQVEEYKKRNDSIRKEIETDDWIDKDQEIMTLKSRQITLFQIKDGELQDLETRRRRYADKVDDLLKQTEAQKDRKISAVQSSLSTNSPLKRSLQNLMRRHNRLNMTIDQLQNGRSLADLAEMSNSKMRQRLRAKMSEM